MGADIQPQVHVVTYVRHGDGFEEPVTEGLLEKTTVSREEPGDATKAVLGTIDEFVCDGSDAHEGDVKTYHNAEERVIARLNQADQVDVTWRRYRPLVAAGHARPGAPFEHRDGETTVRIEARTIVPDDVDVPEGGMSLTDLAAFQKTLKGKRKGAETRENLRDALAKFDGLRNRALARVEKYQAQLGPATLAKDLKAATAASLAAIDTHYDAFRADCVALLEIEVPAAKDAKAILKRVSKDAFDEALTPLAELDEQSKRFQALQSAIDTATEAKKTFTARGATAKRKAYVERLKGHPKPQKVRTAADKVEAALTEVHRDAAAKLDDVVARAKAVMKARTDDELVGSTEAIEAALADIQTAVRKAVAPFRKLEKELSDGRFSGFVEITPVRKDGKIVRWDVRFENTGDEAWIGTQSFVAAGKNSGAGFESMGLPGAGSAAVQPIYANLRYGLNPRAGTKLRIAIRGRSFLEVPLPKDEPSFYSVGQFEQTGEGGDYYFGTRTAEQKRDEKSNNRHDNGKLKIKFYDNGKSLN